MIKNSPGLKKTLDFDNVIKSGLKYLDEHQFPNGEFASYLSGDIAMKEWTMPDSNIFFTGLIGLCLADIDKPLAHHITDKTIPFLKYQMNTGQVWNYFTKSHPLHGICPDDVDDTATISALFISKGIWEKSYNKEILLANRNKAGLFYTWYVLRFEFKRNKIYWRITLAALLRPIKHLFFWLNTEANRNDVDGVVNANVLYCLGDIPETQPVINLINTIIKEEKEANCDLWYRDTSHVYYHFSKNYAKGIKKLEPIVNPIIQRILSKAQPDGRLGETILDTAWNICSLINLDYSGIKLEQAVIYLIQCQATAGYWPRQIAFWGGPKLLVGWGSEELSTAFCLEAIHRFKNAQQNKLK